MTDRPGWAAPGDDEPGRQAEPPVPPGWAPQQPPAHAPAPPGWGQGQPGWRQGQPGWTPPQPGWGPPQPAWGQGRPGWGPPQPGWAPAAKPGVIPLRPLGVGEILDGAISTMRTHPRTMLGFSALVAVATQLLIVPLTWLMLHGTGDVAFRVDQPTTPDQELTLAASSFSAAGVQVVITLVATLILTGMLTVVVSRAVLGQRISAGEAWTQARPRLPALFGVTVLVFLVGVGLAVVAVGPGVLAALLGAPGAVVALALVLGIPAFLVGAVYLYVAFALAPASVVLEKQRVFSSLRRSRALVQGAWWRTFGILLLVNVIAQILAGILSVPFTVGSLAVTFVEGGDHANPYSFVPLLVTGIGTVLASAVTWPFTAASTALIYVDRRIRREALDLELARAAGLAPAGQAATPGTASDPVGPAYGG